MLRRVGRDLSIYFCAYLPPVSAPPGSTEPVAQFGRRVEFSIRSLCCHLARSGCAPPPRRSVHAVGTASVRRYSNGTAVLPSPSIPNRSKCADRNRSPLKCVDRCSSRNCWTAFSAGRNHWRTSSEKCWGSRIQPIRWRIYGHSWTPWKCDAAAACPFPESW